MREPNALVIGLAVAVGMWFSVIVAFSLAIALEPLSSIAANFAALTMFSSLIFFVGRAWGRRAPSKNRVAWGVAATGWLAPWIGVVSGVHGLPEDLGGVFGAVGVVALIVVVVPASLIGLGLRSAWKRDR